MRSTNEIIIAIKECQPVTEEELKFALLALNAIEHFRSRTVDKLIEAIESGNQFRLELQVGFAKGERERMFQHLKTDAQKFVGPSNTPGNPEHERRLRIGKAIFQKATGIDLDS